MKKNRLLSSTSTPPPPPPPPSSPNDNPWTTLPPGWSTAISPDDGRMYYWEAGTGRTSWVHPLATTTGPESARTRPLSVPSPSPHHYNSNDYQLFPSSWQQWGDRSSNNNSENSNSSSNNKNDNSNSRNGDNNSNKNNNDMTTRAERHDTPWNASRRPENHQCYAVVATILCFPIGIFAIYHSIMVDRSWDKGHYGNAVNHSRQATNYACFGTFVGTCFWIYWLFIREGRRMFDWPDFNFDFNFDR